MNQTVDDVGRSGLPLPSVLNGHAARSGDRPALSFVSYAGDSAGTRQTLTFTEVDLRARALAAALEFRFRPGSRVAVLCPQGLEYAVGFLACLYAGMAAVPLHAPQEVRRAGRLAAVLADAAPACLLTTSGEAAACRELTAGRIPVWEVEEADLSVAADWSGRRAAPGETAYLQYTSGSTRSPSGVVITHGNLIASASQCLDGYGCSAATPFASWLPLFHDMGLALGVVVPVLAGAHSVLMSPSAFVQRPVRWLRLLHRHRAWVSGAPDFAFDLCAKKVTDPAVLAELDLSGVGVLINGAEPVRIATLRRFTEAFAPCGLAPQAVKPSYGLAEATVMVACNRPGQRWTELTLDSRALATGRVRISTARNPAAQVTTVPGCGRPVGQEVRVADPAGGVEQEPGWTGELWVRGANVAAGYLGQRDRSAEVFDAQLKTTGPEADVRPGTGGWLRTGDLGFLHDGEVFVLGRIKDVIIVSGTNHAPADLEDTVRQAVPEAVTAGVAVFAVPGDTDEADRVVVALELLGDPTATDRAALLLRVRQAVSRRHGVKISDVVPVRRGGLPRTTSGKLRRGECRDRYLADRDTPAAPTHTEEP